jgi:hypothetical protein
MESKQNIREQHQNRHEQHEVTAPQPLLGTDGVITEPGYAKSLIWEYNREAIKANKLRIKEWDYYIVTGRDFAVAFTVSDLGFIGLNSVSFLQLNEKWERTKTFIKPLTLGRLDLPRTSVTGDVKYKDKHLRVDFLNDGSGKRRIICELDELYDGMSFNCDITLEETLSETMVIATPWKESPTRFYYNQKINCMRASGFVRVGAAQYAFDPQTDFGTLDWGRGVWTYDNVWYWATANGVINEKPFGFNLGYGFSDRSSATENMVFYDGKVHKLDEVRFLIPLDENRQKQYMEPWTYMSNDGRFEAELIPIIDRQATMNFGVIASIQHQVFGRLNGTCKLDDGTELIMKDILCATEDIHNKY